MKESHAEVGQSLPPFARKPLVNPNLQRMSAEDISIGISHEPSAVNCTRCGAAYEWWRRRVSCTLAALRWIAAELNSVAQPFVSVWTHKRYRSVHLHGLICSFKTVIITWEAKSAMYGLPAKQPAKHVDGTERNGTHKRAKCA